MKENQTSYHVACNRGLPTEYVEFLTTHNGDTCRQYRTITLSKGSEVACDCLFGFDLEPAVDVQFWQEELLGEFLKDCVVIGYDPGGAFLIC